MKFQSIQIIKNSKSQIFIKFYFSYYILLIRCDLYFFFIDIWLHNLPRYRRFRFFDIAVTRLDVQTVVAQNTERTVFNTIIYHIYRVRRPLSNLHWYLPPLSYIFVLCPPVFCARQLSLVSRKRIYRNVIFSLPKTNFRVHDSPRPSNVRSAYNAILSMCTHISGMLLFFEYVPHIAYNIIILSQFIFM